MVFSDTEIKFVFSYVAFLLFFIIFVTNMFNAEAIQGLNQAQIETLSEPFVISTDPISFFIQIGNVFNKFIILLSVSSELVLLSILLTPLTIVLVYILVIRIREMLKL